MPPSSPNRSGSSVNVSFGSFKTSGRISTGSERGLLGLAFHPQFKKNGRFYVFFTDRTSNEYASMNCTIIRRNTFA